MLFRTNKSYRKFSISVFERVISDTFYRNETYILGSKWKPLLRLIIFVFFEKQIPVSYF